MKYKEGNSGSGLSPHFPSREIALVVENDLKSHEKKNTTGLLEAYQVFMNMAADANS